MDAKIPPFLYRHGHAPIKSAHDLAYIFDISSEDTVLWYTSPDKGWFDWMALGVLTLGATLLIDENSASVSSLDYLWDIIDRHEITILGLDLTHLPNDWTSAITSAREHSSLRLVGSTNHPWNATQWQWVYDHIAQRRIPVINYFADLQFGGGLLGCTVARPIKAGAFYGPVPGIKIGTPDNTGQLHQQGGRFAIVPSSLKVNFDAKQRTSINQNTGKYTLLPFNLSIDTDGFWYLI